MRIFSKDNRYFITSNLIAVVVLTVLLFAFSSSFLLGNESKAWASASETVDSLAEQAVINSYNCYLENEGHISTASNIELDLYSIYILTEANVSVDQWVYGESSLKTSVLELIDNTKKLEADENPENDVNAKYVAYQYLAAIGLDEETLAQGLLGILIDRQIENSDGTFFNGDYNQWTNLPVFDALSRSGVINQTDMEKGIDYILSLKPEDEDYFSDFMSTAQAVRTLHALKENCPDYRCEEIETVINNGLTWMQNLLREDGSVVFESYGWLDDAVTDTAECILTLNTLGINPDTWDHEVTGETPVDYLMNEAKNPDGTFGSGNIGSNTWALDALNCLGASVGEDTAIRIIIAPEEVKLAVEEVQEFTVTAFLANGDTADVTTFAEWSVSDPSKAELNLDDEKMIVRRVSVGDFEIAVTYQLVNCKVLISNSNNSSGGGGSKPSANEIRVSVSVTGENNDRLFSGRVTLEKNQATIFDALVATGLSYQGDSNFISAIEGQKNRGLNGWMVKVNGELITMSIGSYTLRSGDKVQWFYSSDSANSIVENGGKKENNVSPGPKPVEEIIKALDKETYKQLFAKAEKLYADWQKVLSQLMRDTFAYIDWLSKCL